MLGAHQRIGTNLASNNAQASIKAMAEKLADQGDTVAHAIEHEPHEVARLARLVAHFLEFALTLPEFGDVAIKAEQAAVADRLEHELDVAPCH